MVSKSIASLVLTLILFMAAITNAGTIPSSSLEYDVCATNDASDKNTPSESTEQTSNHCLKHCNHTSSGVITGLQTIAFKGRSEKMAMAIFSLPLQPALEPFTPPPNA
jgi:hypothetical protein